MYVWSRPCRVFLVIAMIVFSKAVVAQDEDVLSDEPAVSEDGDSGAASDDADSPAEEESTPVEEPPVEDSAPAEENAVPPAAATGADTPPSLSEPIGGQPAGTTAPPVMVTVPATPIAPPPVVVKNPPPPATSATEPAAVNPDPDAAAATEDTRVPEPMNEPEDEEEESRFSWFSLSPQIGYAFFPDSDYDIDGLKFSVDQRNSFVAKLHLDLGGDGLAFEITPLFAAEKIGGDLTSFGTDLQSGVSGSLFALGGQMTLAVRGSWGTKFFPHLGIGFHGAYLFGDEIEYGAELYGRIPAGFTWYFAKHFAMVVEFAFMFGATGLKKPTPSMEDVYADLEGYGIDQTQVENIDWTQYDQNNLDELQQDLGIDQGPEGDALMQEIVEDQLSKTVGFGRGVAFELMVGFRFP